MFRERRPLGAGEVPEHFHWRLDVADRWDHD